MLFRKALIVKEATNIDYRNEKQDGQYTYNVSLKHVHSTIVTLEKQ